MHMSANVCAMDDLSTALLRSLIEVGPGSAASALATRYGLDEEDVAADVQAFIADLRRQNLVEVPGSSGPAFDRARAMAARMLIPSSLGLVSLSTRSLRARARGLLWVSKWTLAQFGWARSVREWSRRYPPPASGAAPDAETLEAIDRVVRETAARSLLNLECKERAFACWALARERRIPAQLVVGVTHDPLHGHVWVESGETIISDDPEHCSHFEPVARYG
jgi:hypothetical protein